MNRLRWLLFSIISFALVLSIGFSVPPQAAQEKVPKVGPVKLNPHPKTLAGKTVVLRWNEKMNGDKYLTRVAELLTQQFKNIKVIKLWEVDKSTAAISKDGQDSERVVEIIARQKPDLVIGAQAD